jgi:hypothetical protein
LQFIGSPASSTQSRLPPLGHSPVVFAAAGFVCFAAFGLAFAGFFVAVVVVVSPRS